MPTADLLSEIRNHLPAEEARVVVNRLRNDPLIWASLHDMGFLDAVWAEAGSDLSAWSPANLGRIAVGEGWEDASRWSLNAQEEQRGNQIFDEAVRDHRMPVNLREATCLAVVLLDRWQKDEGVLSLLEAGSGEQEGRLLAIWRTPLACACGMLADAQPLLKAVLDQKSNSLTEALVTHCLLCSPLDHAMLVQILVELISGISPAQQVNWLRSLQVGGQRLLAADLAKALLGKTNAANNNSLTRHTAEKSDLELNVVRLVEMLRMLGLYRYSDQTNNARAMAHKAGQILSHLSARLSASEADLALSEGLVDTALTLYKKSNHLVPSNFALSSESILALCAEPQVENLVNSIPQEISTPVIEIYRAKTRYDQGSQAAAREAASTAALQLSDCLGAQPVGMMTASLADWQPVHLIKTLVGMNLFVESLSLVEKLLESRPVDAGLLEWASDLSSIQNNLNHALEYSVTLQVLEPGNPARRRHTARLLEKMGAWQQARSEREQIVKMTGSQLGDWLDLGFCWLKLGDWNSVLKACDYVLEREPDSGKACSLKGQAYMALGKKEEALELLNQATLLSPEEAEPWLALARIQSEAGDERRSMETMKAAVQAVPDNPEINHNLAKTFIRGGLFSDSLPFLRKAAALVPDSVEVILDLATTLAALGHQKEARQVLVDGRKRWPTHAPLAHTFAQIALLSNDREEALQALDVALRSESISPDWVILYAQTLTRYEPDGTRPQPDSARLVHAQLGLEEIINQHPEPVEPRLLKAEVVLARGDYNQAYGLFQGLIEGISTQPDQSCRVQAGLGEAALHSGMVDNALAALKEALQSQPDDPRLHRLLAETYLAGQLEQEAAAAARDALKCAPDGLEMLEWYASFMARLGDPREAVQALRTATMLAPQGAVYWIGLAEMQIRQDNYPEAGSALDTALRLSTLTPEQLQRIARAFLCMHKEADALSCLQRAVKSGTDPELWIELAYLYQLNRRYDEALDALRQAVSRMPEMPWLVVFQADLLMQSGHYKSAAASLGQVQKALEGRTGRPTLQMLRSLLIPIEFQTDYQQPYAVPVRYAQLERCTGNPAGALHFAETALEKNPERLELRSMAADLACALLLTPRASQLADMHSLPVDQASLPDVGAQQAVVTLLCQQAELALDSGDLEKAGSAIQKGESIQAEFARLLAVKTRWLVRSGEWLSATAVYQHLNELTRADCAELTYSVGNPANQYWMVQAALDMLDMDAALSMAQDQAKAYPNEPQSLFGLIKAVVLCSEHARLCQEVYVSVHTPQVCCQDPVIQEQFESALASLVKMTNPILVEGWRSRGRALFKPGIQTLRALADLMPSATEAAPLVALLRSTNNLSGAIQTGKEYPDCVPVLVQLALCHLNVDPAQGLVAINRAAELDPSHPVVLAVLALTMQKNGYTAESLEAWERALRVWGDEPQWHAKAAELASEIGDIPASVAHWESAAELDPSNLDTIAALSQAYLENGQYERAMQALENATTLDETRADLWYLLAQANRYANRLLYALTCAEKARGLQPEAVPPVLLCGEIALQMGNPDLAMEFAAQAFEVQPGNEAAILFQVKVHEWKKKPSDGLNLLEKMITPDSSVTMMLAYARLVYSQRGAAAALPMLKKLAESDAHDAGVLNLLARAQEESGEMAGAEKSANQALQIQPNLPGLNLLLGRLKRQSGQLDQSIRYLTEAIRQDPENTDAYLELGKTYIDRRELLQALRVFEKAIQINPSDPRAHYQAGIVLRESKDYVGAENMLRRAAELDPQDIAIRRLLGAVITLNLIHNSQEVGLANGLH